MENKKDIGHAVREKLDGLQKQPTPAVWENIKADLDSRKKPKRFPLLITTGAVIGILAILVILGYFLGIVPDNFNPAKGSEENIVNGNYGRSKEFDTDSATVVNTEQRSATEKGNTTSGRSNTPEHSGNNENSRGTNAEQNTHENSTYSTSNNTVTGKTDKIKNRRDKTDKNTFTKSTKPSVSGATINKTKIVKGTNTTVTATQQYRKLKSNSNNRPDSQQKGLRKIKSANNKNDTDFNTGIAPSYNQKNNVAGRSGKEKTAKATEGITLSETIGKSTPEQDSDRGINNGNGEQPILKDNATKNITAENTLPAVDSLAITKVQDSLKKPKCELAGDTKKDTAKGPVYKQFYAFAYAAPTAFKYPSGKSILGRQLDGNKTTGKVTFNYGAFLGYKVTDHLELRAGIAITRTEQETSGIVSDTAGGFRPSYSGISYAAGVNSATLATRFNRQPFSLVQKTQFTEIPVEALYHVAGNQWGIRAIAGLSLVNISKNEVIAQGNGTSLFVGSVKNTGAMGFSAGLGAGFYYKLSPSLQLNAEPHIKYYVNTFTDASPISFSLRIGLQYNFNLPKKKK